MGEKYFQDRITCLGNVFISLKETREPKQHSEQTMREHHETKFQSFKTSNQPFDQPIFSGMCFHHAPLYSPFEYNNKLNMSLLNNHIFNLGKMDAAKFCV